MSLKKLVKLAQDEETLKRMNKRIREIREKIRKLKEEDEDEEDEEKTKIGVVKMLNYETVKKNYAQATINKYYEAIESVNMKEAKEANEEYKKLTGKYL